MGMGGGALRSIGASGSVTGNMIGLSSTSCENTNSAKWRSLRE